MLSHNYSLWLEPAAGGAVRERLQREIRAQCAAHAGPPFEAHVTLLADVQLGKEELLEKAAGLAKRLKVRLAVRVGYRILCTR